MEKLVIKKLGEADAALYASIRDLLFSLYPSRPPIDERAFSGLLREAGIDILVAMHGQEVVATASLISYEKLGGFVSVIEDVVVAEGKRGSGIGTELTRALLEYARTRGAQFVDVFTRRPEARTFYLKCGFLDKNQDYPFFALRHKI